MKRFLKKIQALNSSHWLAGSYLWTSEVRNKNTSLDSLSSKEQSYHTTI